MKVICLNKMRNVVPISGLLLLIFLSVTNSSSQGVDIETLRTRSLAGDGPAHRPSLRTRVLEYDEALQNKDFALIYRMQHQPFRETITEDAFIKLMKGSGAADAFEVVSIGKITMKGYALSLDGKRLPVAQVQLFINGLHEGKKEQGEYIDVWIFENGDWYHAPE